MLRTATKSLQSIPDGAEDRAIVVGINRYPDPGLGDLAGPTNDARAFSRWLEERAGVPRENIRRILSSAPYRSRRMSVLDARPTNEAIGRAFDELQDLSERGAEQGVGRRIGRRLYIYLAGHGFSPNSDEVALLMANATSTRTHHVPARVYANYFVHSGCFDQVVLFMDCCRDPFSQDALWLLPYVKVLDRAAIDRAKVLFGFSAQWTHSSREKRLGGKVRGIFSYTLLAALNGAAPDVSVTDGTEVTARSLADYTYLNMRSLLSDEERSTPSINQEPDFDYDPRARFTLLRFANTEPPTFPVTIHYRPEDVGRELRIFDDDATTLRAHATLPRPLRLRPGALEWKGALPPGLYLGEIPGTGRRRIFSVTGRETAHVTL